MILKMEMSLCLVIHICDPVAVNFSSLNQHIPQTAHLSHKYWILKSNGRNISSLIGSTQLQSIWLRVFMYKVWVYRVFSPIGSAAVAGF